MESKMISPIEIPFLLKLIQPIDFPHKLGVAEKFFGHVLAPEGIAWVRTAAKVTWKLDLANPTHRWIVYGKYEGASFLNWARHFLPKNGIVVDSGANIGQMVQYLAQWVPQGRVLAFEPGSEAFHWLEECLIANPNLSIDLIPYGLGAESTQAILQDMGKDKGYRHVHGAWSYITESETEGETVRIVRLGDELIQRKIDTIDLWKLDVEGYEMSALQGAEEYLKSKSIKAIYVELVGEIGHMVRDYLSEFSYACYCFNGSKLEVADEIPNHSNGLFLPK